MTGLVTPTLDPRYAFGLCLHGKPSDEADPERVPVVTSEAEADRLIDERKAARAYTRAIRKQVAGQVTAPAAALAARRSNP